MKTNEHPATFDMLAIAEIHASPTNPRKTFPEAEQGELIESVKRHGVSPDTIRREMQVEKEEKAAKKKGKGAKAPAPVVEPVQAVAAEVQPNTADVQSAVPFKVGDRVRVTNSELASKRKVSGKQGEVKDIDDDVILCLFDDDDRMEWFDSKFLALSKEAPTETTSPPAAETTSTPEKLAPADDSNSAKSDQAAKKAKTTKAAPAADGKSSKPEVQYRHPEIQFATWSGRGKKPRWVEKWLENGGTLDQLRGQRPAKGKARQAHIEKNEKPIVEEVHQRCTKTLELPGLDIEMNATPIAAVTPAAHSNHAAH